MQNSGTGSTAFGSPPTRAEWIEIIGSDRNDPGLMSPPTRAEWIEIQISLKKPEMRSVSAHTGGVD